MSEDALVVKNNTPVGRRNRFDEYNMHEDIKKWRYEGNSFKKIINLIKEKFDVNVSYTALYTYCVRKGLTGDMSGERQRTVNGYQELIDSLGVIKQSLALNQALFEDLERESKEGNLDTKKYTAVVSSSERLLTRRESLIKTIIQQQSLIYKYSAISRFIGRFEELVIERFGLDVWNDFKTRVVNDFEIKELMKRIPKDNDVVPIKKNCPKNEGKMSQKLGVSL
ncbi:hypothetical protein [Megamonas funiformis]|uniref:hypothetical protein n=1 Tax=Megamonas funiformis TaxID=437897 RepID=UPI00206D1B48|nr:hypothetical protein [Megamonas funiformis]DAI87665.1 MAG TPA: protein of unknown function (DUF5338) [Caudoviricetes sp.]